MRVATEEFFSVMYSCYCLTGLLVLVLTFWSCFHHSELYRQDRYLWQLQQAADRYIWCFVQIDDQLIHTGPQRCRHTSSLTRRSITKQYFHYFWRQPRDSRFWSTSFAAETPRHVCIYRIGTLLGAMHGHSRHGVTVSEWSLGLTSCLASMTGGTLRRPVDQPSLFHRRLQQSIHVSANGLVMSTKRHDVSRYTEMTTAWRRFQRRFVKIASCVPSTSRNRTITGPTASVTFT